MTPSGQRTSKHSLFPSLSSFHFELMAFHFQLVFSFSTYIACMLLAFDTQQDKKFETERCGFCLSFYIAGFKLCRVVTGI